MKSGIDITLIDSMTGVQFERFLIEALRQVGYTAQETKASGDQGIDIIINTRNEKIGIQAKRYNITVGNKAVQEVAAVLICMV